MEASVTVAIVTSCASLAAGALAFLSNRRTEATRLAAEATKGQAEHARVQIEQWQALLDRYESELARVTADRDRYRQALVEREGGHP